MSAIITLTTDFGAESPYVGQMKGVILSINPAACIVDISHGVAPQNIRQAALVLAESTVWYPAESIHVAVVDPGVGTARKILCARLEDRWYVAPDNGLLSILARRFPPSTIRVCEQREYWRPEVSATFHGRDIMAPVAAHLSRGVDSDRLGPPLAELTHLDWPEARVLENKVEGEIVAIDSFGNLITNITSEALRPAMDAEGVVIRCDEHETLGIQKAYADHPPMTLIALIGSSGKLELAIVNDNAQTMLGVREGAPVTVTW